MLQRGGRIGSLFSLWQSSKNRSRSLIDDYEITGFVGKGSTSRVFQGYNVINKRQVIIKLFKDIIPEEKIKRQIRVNQMLIGSPHIIPLIDAIQDQGCKSYALIFQNFHGVTLNHMIGKIAFRDGLRYSKQILLALEACHKTGIVHRDLKSSNILISGAAGAKVFDFGLSRIQKIDEFVTRRFGTKCYYPPEVLFKIPHFNEKVDIWTCGIIMAELLGKKKPLMPYTSDEEAQRQAVEMGGYDENIVPYSSFRNINRFNFNKLLQGKDEPKQQRKVAQVLKKMLSLNPELRPSATQILSHDIFTQIQV